MVDLDWAAQYHTHQRETSLVTISSLCFSFPALCRRYYGSVRSYRSKLSFSPYLRLTPAPPYTSIGATATGIGNGRTPHPS